ncbi:GSCOCT00000038001.2-RA-CDS [Cotesia congregata]|uniref:Odorant binding protein 1.54 n=1 Tax=Cotesia congregata TaxID=51543 RepID=A0A8J2HK57_COTCN|nr:GSCOCT00000038001.2-RA-CDS [Cotesia congregata]CAG5100962.1 Odorant binding protein 1.54 [Cotesia congregata]
MKVFASIFALGFIGILGNIADSNSENSEYLKQCMAESGVDQTSVDKLQGREWEMNNKKLQCYSKCLMIKKGVINDDGTLNEENMKKDMTREFPDGKIDEVMMKCKDPKGADACENSLLILKCFLDYTIFAMQKDKDN